MTKAEDRLMTWLRDAHAAEKQAESMLGGMARRLEHYPALRARIEKHIEETKRQATDLEGCIESRGGSTSTIKDTGASLMGMGQAMSGMFTSDEVLKGTIASYAFEAMEIASYEILISTARSLGDTKTAGVCERILKEEESMADWLRQNMPQLTTAFLAREDAGETAKH
jgi:ferritin-like metal-binding protein YciE